jgi:flagellar motor switch protein FliN/FliY
MSDSVVKLASAAKADDIKVQPNPAARVSSELLRGVRVSLEARLGRVGMTVEEMMALGTGSIVTLDTGIVDRIELYLNNTLVACGEIVAVGDKYGVRITDVAQKP